jgi:hypothetical protein
MYIAHMNAPPKLQSTDFAGKIFLVVDQLPMLLKMTKGHIESIMLKTSAASIETKKQFRNHQR